MDWYATIKRMYDRKLWPKQWVADGVIAGKITAAQYESITGEPYPMLEETPIEEPTEVPVEEGVTE